MSAFTVFCVTWWAVHVGLRDVGHPSPRSELCVCQTRAIVIHHWSQTGWQCKKQSRPHSTDWINIWCNWLSYSALISLEAFLWAYTHIVGLHQCWTHTHTHTNTVAHVICCVYDTYNCCKDDYVSVWGYFTRPGSVMLAKHSLCCTLLMFWWALLIIMLKSFVCVCVCVLQTDI